MFVGFQPVPGVLVPFAYDWPMVGLSFLISVCGAYVGLRWSRRVRLPDGRLDVDACCAPAWRWAAVRSGRCTLSAWWPTRHPRTASSACS